MQIKKALTFRASSLGDCLMGKYLLENIHLQFPDARLGIVVASRGAMIRDLLADAPWLEVIETNRRDIRGLIRLWRRYHGSDLIVTQYTGKHSGQFGLASKFAARVLVRPGGLIGFYDISPWNTFLYSRLLPVRSDQAVVQHEREALKAAGLGVPLPYPKLTLEPDPNVLKKYNLTPGGYVVVHFFAGVKGRSIHPDNRRELLQALAAKLPGVTFVISGGPGDKVEATLAAEGTRSVVVAGMASLREMKQLLLQSRGVVSVDTGIAHLSAQLHKPLVVMRTCLGPNWWLPEQYGPSVRVKQMTREDLCHPHVNKDYPDCLSAINSEDVAEAFVLL